MSTALLLIHGRSQQMPAGSDRSDAAVADYVARKKREWLAGLAKGATLAGRAQPDAGAVYFPYYGNVLADRIAAHEKAGGTAPQLEGLDVAAQAKATGEDLLLDGAAEIGFVASRRLEQTDPELAGAARDVEKARASGEEASWGDLLRPKVVREALRFISDKTGAPQAIITRFLSDVAYYLEDDAMRDAVQEVVSAAIAQASADGHTDLVVVGHSLGSCVAYDALQRYTPGPRVRLLVTAGSPDGYAVVKRNLWGGAEGDADRGIPGGIEPVGGTLRWLNAYDEHDVVALVHPLTPLFAPGSDAMRDERAQNPSDPHSIQDYLSDPDVAAAVLDAVGAAQEVP
ncbi:hypothetical protein ASD62_01995 [Phycicoccus sp. Root563]|uniref:hypothetical protein n=1 Tax=unclassified Phycicoccus TaxID=2637926 RepID=UPI000702C059|nr:MULTISPECIES: hypothetical protein [unclassified Phycicoccus]KQU68787.1 hypothetical protein ASC58_08845 [Phycicoccus sp. Root101]KQZ88278.1 hypothetical protein ASD62_01995 [Phycicoccus sp. Root563]